MIAIKSLNLASQKVHVTTATRLPVQNAIRCSSWKIKRQLPEKVNSDPKKDDSSIILHTKSNMPDFEMQNPYEKEKRKCILCRLNITPDYKNTRLLSQFVSRFTGRPYGRHITGLCKKKQALVENAILMSHISGLMPGYFRDPRFAYDPKLFDPDNPFRPHNF